jgi:hypothetical protein
MARYLCRAISKDLKRRRIVLAPFSTKRCSTGHQSYGTIRLRTIATGARAPEPQGSASRQWCPPHDSPVTSIRRPCRRVTGLLHPLPPFPTNTRSTGHRFVLAEDCPLPYEQSFNRPPHRTILRILPYIYRVVYPARFRGRI